MLNIKMPTVCPVCQTKLSLNDNHTKLFCPNDSCATHIGGRIRKWTKTLGIKEFGDSTIETLTEYIGLNSLADLYSPDVYEKLESVPGFGHTSVQKMKSEVESHRDMTLVQFMTGLNIGGIGEKLWEHVIQEKGFKTVQDVLSHCSPQDFIMDQVSIKRATVISKTIKSMKYEIEAVANCVNIQKPVVAAPIQGVLKGESFCFTGKSSLPRKQLWKLVEENGGIIHEGIKKETCYLILADVDSTSGKAKAALKNGTCLLSEADFMKMIGK